MVLGFTVNCLHRCGLGRPYNDYERAKAGDSKEKSGEPIKVPAVGVLPELVLQPLVLTVTWFSSHGIVSCRLTVYGHC